MTYSTSPTLDADRYLTQRDEEGAELDRAEKLIADEFRAAVRKGDVKAFAFFAPKVTAWELKPLADGTRFKRYPSIAEAMTEALDYGDGPKSSDLMALLVKVSRGEPQTAQARELINQMAEAFARHNVGVV